VLSVDTLMKSEPVGIEAAASVTEAARRMREAKVGALLVLERGALVGVFSERDLARRVVAEGRDPARTPVGEVASRPVISVESGTSLRECAETLRARGVRHLPVLEGGKPAGMLSARDFFDALAGGFEGLIERARYSEVLRENVDPYDHLGGSYGR
jgi:CBS domain-containing protein